MLQNYRFSGTFKTVTLTNKLTNYTINNITYKHIINNLYTSYPHGKNTYNSL